MKPKLKSRSKSRLKQKQKVYELNGSVIALIVTHVALILIMLNKIKNKKQLLNSKNSNDTDHESSENIDTIGLDNIRGLSNTEMGIVKNISKINVIDSAIVNRFNVVELTQLSREEKIKLAEWNIKKILGSIEIDDDSNTIIINNIKTLDNRGVVKFLTKIRGCCNVNNITKINRTIIETIMKSRFYGHVKKEVQEKEV